MDLPLYESTEEDLRRAVHGTRTTASYRLLILSGEDKGKQLLVRATTPPALVGADPICELVLRDRRASRRHLRVTAEPRVLRITDLGSKNGTFVNGVRIDGADLVGAETLRVGGTFIRVDAADATSAPEWVDDAATVLEDVISADESFAEARERVIAHFERIYVAKKLERYEGNVTRAAAGSGLARRYFHRLKARHHHGGRGGERDGQ